MLTSFVHVIGNHFQWRRKLHEAINVKMEIGNGTVHVLALL